MKVLAGTKISALVLLALALAVGRPVSAQITTGTVAGTIKDTQGGVIPGATVVLISESRGTKSIPVVTNETGDWVMPNVTADTYTVEVTMSGFKTLTRKGVLVSGGDRVVVGTLTLQVGGTTETVDVTAEAPMIQAQSG
ncbi:MAG TPA: carboxypeptidase-like regulatory domain-containing protein, partial [Vicinamibacterales bacterium]|nr:carboxypeptidase-like regulatory domain-containing protein [Vicinamibacterales bacterium]